MIYRYEHPGQFAGLEAPDFAEFSGNIVMWGAGKIGSVVAHVLRREGIRALAFVDMSASKHGGSFCGLKIISPEELLREHFNSALIITTVGRDDVVDFLETNNFSNYHDAWPLLLEFDFGDYREHNQMYMARMIGYYFRVLVRSLNLRNEYTANRLRVMVTSRCSLRCKECSTFVPYVRNPRDDEWAEIVADVKTFLDSAGRLQEVEFLGGEPLLHPDLDKMISGLKDEPRIEQIAIVSNGTILPGDALVQAMVSDGRAIFRMSSYGGLSKKLGEAKSLLSEKGVRHEIIDYKTWYKSSQVKSADEDEDELKRKFNNCMKGCGLVCWSGKLFFCATLPFLIEAGAFPQADDNFYDMRKKDVCREQLLSEIFTYADRCNTDNYVDACRYCTGKTSTNFGHSVQVAEQIRGLLKTPAVNDA
jgi:organic radical activating enzyme